jgi:hypothetical protein
VAIFTGLNHRLLRRRAMPIRGDEADQWHSVWEGVRLASEKHWTTTAAVNYESVR